MTTHTSFAAPAANPAGIPDPSRTHLQGRAKTSGSAWVRRIHRWVSMAFTVTVIANFVALSQGTPPAWVTYSPLLPIAVLLFSGLYLFALPYVARWRGGRRTG